MDYFLYKLNIWFIYRHEYLLFFILSKPSINPTILPIKNILFFVKYVK
jgi:hypothetical protein